jgi:PKD repeat protein
MIAIAVVASLVAYAWVMGYMNFQTSKAGNAIQIPSFAAGSDADPDDTDRLRVYVQNVGEGTVKVGTVYVNDIGVGILSPDDLSIGKGATLELLLDLNSPWAAGQTLKVKVVTTDGTFMEMTGKIPSAQQQQNPPANMAPVARFTYSANGLTVNFNASTSSDSDGTIVSYSWNFGDGGSGSGVTASRTYSAAGTYNVVLTVTDDDGAIDTETHGVTVSSPPPANNPPTASFTYTANGLTVQFTDTSVDSDGSVVGWSWNFGDGTPLGTTRNPSHTYAAAGTYSVSLTVTDDDGAASSPYSQNVVVSVPNSPPVAAFTWTANGLSVTFDSSASYDPDGNVVGWLWNFGDGSPTSNVQNPIHDYAAAGTYTVSLTVTDNGGASSTPVTHDVSVKVDPTISTPTLNPASPITIGGSTQATVTVLGSQGTPTGTVTFEYSTNGGSSWSQLGAVKTLSGGSATSDPYSPTTDGEHLIRAIYSGDSNYNDATSSAASLTVDKATPTVPAPTLSETTITLGDSVTASVTVSGSAGTPTGQVTFEFSTNGGADWSQLGAVKTLSGGSATSDAYSPTTVGDHLIRAVYSGDDNYNGATGSAVTLTVNVPFGIDTFASSSTTGSSITLSITTNYGNEILYLSVVEQFSRSVTSITSNPSLTWQFRASERETENDQLKVETWYAICPSSGTISITINFNGNTAGAATVIGISGADIDSPFDSTAVSNHNDDQTSGSVSKSVSNANTLIIGAIGTTGNPTHTATGGFTKINQQAASTSYALSIEYRMVTSTGTYTPGYSWTGNQDWAIIGDAIQKAMGKFGNEATGTSSVSISGAIRGAPYVAPATGNAESISAYVNVGYTTRNLKAAIYSTSGVLLGQTNSITGVQSGARWVTMTFSTKPTLTAGTTYILVVWADTSPVGPEYNVNLYYSGTSTDAGRYQTITYGNWPNPAAFTNDNYQYCIYCTYSIP